MAGFVKHDETERWIEEADKDNPLALQYDIPPVRGVPIYDPFDERNKKEAIDTYRAFSRVDPVNADRREVWLDAGTNHYLGEILPDTVDSAQNVRTFSNRAEEHWQKGEFEEALKLFDAEIEKHAPGIEKVEDDLAALIARVADLKHGDFKRMLALVKSVRLPEGDAHVSVPVSEPEKDLVAIIASGSKNIPNGVKALMLNRAQLQENIANEEAARDFDSSGGALTYTSRKASDNYYASAIARLLTGPLPGIYDHSPDQLPPGYMEGLHRKAIEKIEELLVKATNWRPRVSTRSNVTSIMQDSLVTSPIETIANAPTATTMQQVEATTSEPMEQDLRRNFDKAAGISKILSRMSQ